MQVVFLERKKIMYMQVDFINILEARLGLWHAYTHKIFKYIVLQSIVFSNDLKEGH